MKATKKAAKRAPKAKKTNNCVPLSQRTALAIKLHKAGKLPSEIALTCGYAKGNGTGWVKHTLIAAGLRK